MNCPDCNSDNIVEGTCRDCGLIVDESPVMLPPIRDYEHPDAFQYGDPRTHAVADMSMMTYTDPRDRCDSIDLKRALRMDGYFGQEITKTIRLNNEMKEICTRLNLNKNFLSECYYFFRKHHDEEFLKGKKLQHTAPALVYLLIRMYSEAYVLFDFEELGYNSQKVYKYYTDFVQSLNLYTKIKPQDPLIFINKLVNSVLDEHDYLIKYNLIRWVMFYFKGLLNRLEKIDHLLVFDNNSGFHIICACVYIAVSNLLPQREIEKRLNCGHTALWTYTSKIKKLQKFDVDNLKGFTLSEGESEYFKQFAETASECLGVPENIIKARIEIGKNLILKEFDDKSKELYNNGLRSHIDFLKDDKN